MRNYLKIKGTVLSIDEPEFIKRKTAPGFNKAFISLKTEDGQTLYPEFRNTKVKLLENLEIDDVIELEFAFEGSEKNDKKYNNIYANGFKKL